MRLMLHIGKDNLGLKRSGARYLGHVVTVPGRECTSFLLVLILTAIIDVFAPANKRELSSRWWRKVEAFNLFNVQGCVSVTNLTHPQLLHHESMQL